MGCGCHSHSPARRVTRGSSTSVGKVVQTPIDTTKVNHSVNLQIVEARTPSGDATDMVRELCGPNTALFTNDFGQDLTIRYTYGASTQTKVVRQGSNFCAPPVRVDRLALVLDGEYTEHTAKSLLSQNRYWPLVISKEHIQNLNFAQVRGSGSVIQQVLKGLAVAATVGSFRYVALCHDALYPKEHFEHANHAEALLLNRSMSGLGENVYVDVEASYHASIWDQKFLLHTAQNALVQSMQTTVDRDVGLSVEGARSIKTYGNIMRINQEGNPKGDNDKTWGSASSLWSTVQ